MTMFLQHYTLSYTSLSPIHIGTGDSYEPTNYIIDDGTLYEFDTGSVIAALTESDRQMLNKTVSGKPSEDMLKALQRFFFEKRAQLKPFSINAIPVLDGVAQLYASRIGQTANRESGGKQVLNKLEIDRTAYNPVTRQPVLYGSSIKGAIRTALLDQINQGQRTHERKGLHEFQGQLFKYRDPERGKLSLEQDPLRLIGLGDAAWSMKLGLPTTQVHLAVNRKKTAVVDQKGNLRAAMGENLYQILECVPSAYPDCFTGPLTLQSIEGPAAKVPAKELRFQMQTIADACNRFYVPLWTAERKLMIQRGYGDEGWQQLVNQILSAKQEKIKNGQAFLLRIGRHSGAEAVTVAGARNGNIKIMKGKGQPPEYADTPKTLWLAANDPKQHSQLLPFGWLLVEIHAGGVPAADNPELAQLCADHHQQARQWAENHARQQQAFSEQRQVAEQKREQEAQQRIADQARQHAEALAAEQARLAEQQRQASLSPMELEIEAFLKAIPPAEHDTRLLQELEKGQWQGEDMKVVAQKVQQLMQQAGKWLPDFNGDNKQKLKLKQRSQTVLSYLQD